MKLPDIRALKVPIGMTVSLSHRAAFRLAKRRSHSLKLAPSKRLFTGLCKGKSRLALSGDKAASGMRAFPAKSKHKSCPKTGAAVGVDVGLEKFASLSDGTLIENPRFFRQDEKALAKAQRRMSKFEKGSRERRKARKVVARIHERIRNRRHNFTHQTARRIVNRYDVIAVEKLSPKKMMKNHCLAKSIGDAAWSQFRQVVCNKAESAGRRYVEINPAYTSQTCSGCGTRTRKTLSQRWHLCSDCGTSLDRDQNAALNIIAAGLRSIGTQPVEAPAFRRTE